MSSPAEQTVSRSLRAALAGVEVGAEVPASDGLREALSGLEYFIPEVLSERHREWGWEGLDGIHPVTLRKTGEDEVDVLGLCVLIADQTLTPLHLRLQLSPTGPEVSWLECRLGERGDPRLIRTPYNALDAMARRLDRLREELDRVGWAYEVTFGRRRR